MRQFFSETVLVTAAAGATGLAAIDLCSHVFKCSNVIGCCGSQEKCDFILKNGATHAINYKLYLNKVKIGYIFKFNYLKKKTFSR